VTDTLTVHLDRSGPQSVSVADSFETTGSFTLALHNHGSPAHVHLHADDALARVVDIGARNHYLESDAVRTVEVTAGESFGTVSGRLEVVTGYGAESGVVTVTLTEPPTVTVDETLGEPASGERRRNGVDVEALPLVAVAFVAVALFVLVAAVVGETAALLVGVGAVLAGVASALYLLVWS
jgi:hypothetical protein